MWLSLWDGESDETFRCLNKRNIYLTIKPFIVQLIHTQSLLKQIKIKKAAPKCFGLQGNHHQGASQRLAKITHLVHVGT